MHPRRRRAHPWAVTTALPASTSVPIASAIGTVRVPAASAAPVAPQRTATGADGARVELQLSPTLPGEEVLTLRLPDADLHRLWSRLAATRPGLEHFSPSPLMATAALENVLGDVLGGAWIEIRRVPGGMIGASGWILRAHRINPRAAARLRDLVEGSAPIAVPSPVSAEPDPGRRRARIVRVALAGALSVLMGLLLLTPPAGLPG